MSHTWILGAGPSLKGMDLDFLTENGGHNVIAVNRSWELVPRRVKRLDVYWTDYRFFGIHQSRLNEIKFFLPNVNLHAAADETGRKYPPEVNVWPLTGASGLEKRQRGLRHGNNSGYAAINLAYQLGYETITLLGYDMRLGPNGEGHFHEEHPWGDMKSQTLQDMLPYYSELNIEITKKGVIVINCTQDSALRAFPYMPLDIALQLRFIP